MSARVRRVIPVLAVLAVIAALTLRRGVPASPDDTELLDPYCLICGRKGASDAALNVLLFVPLGLAAARVWGWLPTLCFGAAVSAGIEITQATIPYRFPTVGDIVWNASGTAVGAALVHGRAALAAARPGARLALAAALVVLPLLPAALLTRAPTFEPYFAQWAPKVSERSYAGRVESASIDGLPLPAGPLASSDGVRAALRRGAPLRISFVPVASSEVTPSHLFRFMDARGAEIGSIAVRGLDLVWTERTAATAARFGSPRVAWVGALAGVATDSVVTLVLRKEDGSVCMAVAGRERCGLRFRPRDGWQLLLPDAGGVWGRLMGGLWLSVPALAAGIVAGALLIPTAGAAAIAVAALAVVAGRTEVGVEPVDAALLLGALLAGAAIVRMAPLGARKRAASA